MAARVENILQKRDRGRMEKESGVQGGSVTGRSKEVDKEGKGKSRKGEGKRENNREEKVI